MKEKKNSVSIGILIAIVGTFIARMIGFIRELFVANVFGTSALGDAFVVAFSLPDILVDGFSYAVAQLYIPTLYRIRNENKDKSVEREFNSSVILFVTVVALFNVVLIELFPNCIVKLFVPGFSDSTLNISVHLVRITILSIIPICLSAVFKAYGQIINKYGVYVTLGVIINAFVIVALVIYRDANLTALAASIFMGNLFYMLIIASINVRNKYRISSKFSLSNYYLKNLVIGIFPVLMSSIISEINQIIDKNFASRLEEGAVSALNYSSKIINLVTAIVGTAIVSVLFSKISKLAMEQRYERLSEEIIKINSCIIALILPFFYLFIFARETIISFLFERGNFDVRSVELTAECLAFYSVGVIGFNVKAIWGRIYNASLNTRVPAINSIITVLMNIFFNIVLMPTMKHRGLALATGIASILSNLMLIMHYRKVNIYFNIKVLFREIAIIMLVSAIYIPFFKVYGIVAGNKMIVNLLILISIFVLGSIIYVFLIGLSKTQASSILKKYVNRIAKSVLRYKC